MIGEKLAARYEVLGELGQGGMGVIYRARDQVLGRDVAIKVIAANTAFSAEAEQRFRSEAQVIAQLDHPGIIAIYDFGRHNGGFFYVMPVVEGHSLRAMIDRRELAVADVLDVGVAVAEALAYAHAREIVHRDVKPENIMVARDSDGRLRVTVMDFGLARSAGDDPITKTGVLIGTVAYLSPEQISGKIAEAPADIYSLGTVLYECLANEPPFVGDSQAVLYRIVHEFPAPLRGRPAAIAVSEQLEAVVMSCLAKKPGERPPAMTALARALRRLRARPDHATGEESDADLHVSPLRRLVDAPLVGRHSELVELQQRLSRAAAGEGHFVLIGGDAGAGKSRLLAEIEALALARKVTALHGNLADQASAFPYFGFCELIVDYFKGPGPSGGPPPDLSDLAPELIALFPTLGEINAIRPAAAAQAPAPARVLADRGQIFETLARALVRLSASGPLLLLLEDVHAADAAIEALHYIARRLVATPTLIIATYRASEVDRAHPIQRMIDDLRGSRRFVALHLGALSRTEHRQLLGDLMGEAPLPEAVAERLYEATEGNPFFTQQIVRSLLTASDGQPFADWAMVSPSLLSSALPATIQQAIDRRISRLPADLRDLLACAAVLGKSFDARDLGLLARDVDDLDDALDRLIEEGMLEEDRVARGDRLSFVSGVVREVLYAQIPRRRRRALHRRYAAHLEERHAGRLERVYSQLLHHYAGGDVADRSVLYGLESARRSLAAFSPDEALRAGRTALEFLDEEWEGDPAAIGEVRELLALAHHMAGDLDAALREAEAAIACYERHGRAAPKIRALLLAARAAWQARRVDDARRWVEQGLHAARAADDRGALAQLLALAATLAGLRGESELAAEHLREAAALGPTAPPDAGPAPTRGGRLAVALASPAVACEPAAIQTQEDAEVLANVFETLLVTDEDGHPLPCLAERWEPRDRGHAYLFTLRAGVRFHDGHALTAADVVASLVRLARLRAGALLPVLAAIDGIDALLTGEADTLRGLRILGELRLEIQLTRPLSIFPALIAAPAAAICRISDESAASGVMAAGTGPFRLASCGVRATVIERFDGHWRGAPHLDAIDFRFVESAAAMAQGLRAGELDLLRALTPEELEELGAPGSAGATFEGPVKLTYFAAFNAHTGPLARDLQVRRALARVVPVQELVWQLLGRLAAPARGLIPPGILGYDPGRRRPHLSPPEAAALLRAAGVAEGARLRVLALPVVLDRYRAFLDALCACWSELGLALDVGRLDVAALLDRGALPEDVDVVVLRWGADYDDPDDFTFGSYHSVAGRLRRCYSSAEADQLVERGRLEGDPAARERCYDEIEALLERDGAVLPLFHATDHRIAAVDVRGLRLRGSPPFVNYEQLSRPPTDRRRKEAPASAVIRTPIRGRVTALDPVRGGYTEYHEVLPCIFESLTRQVGGAQIIPWLAESMEALDGGMAYRFRLRRDITFHDGRRLTARDVRYSFERMLQRPDATERWLFEPILGARALLSGAGGDLEGFHISSDHELVIELVRPLVYFPGLLSHSVCAIIPEGADRRGERWSEMPVGTGPFRVVHFEPGRRLDLGRAPAYWRPGYPRCRALSFHFGVTPAEIRAGFEAGRYAIASELAPEDIEALRRDPIYASGYQETPSFGTYFIALNTRRGPLADPQLRRQIARALDRPRLARQALGRLAKPALSMIPPGLLGYEAERGTDPGDAIDTPGAAVRDLELTALVHPVFLSEYRAYYRRICAALAALGIRLKIFEAAYQIRDLPDPEQQIDLDFTRWYADYPDAHSFVGLLHSREGHLAALCGGERYDRLLERGQAISDPQARHAIYRQIEGMIAQEACLIPLFHPQSYRFVRPEITGLELSHGGPSVAYEALAVQGDEPA
jgi:ABC-type transport system substrate-binding protein